MIFDVRRSQAFSASRRSILTLLAATTVLPVAGAFGVLAPRPAFAQNQDRTRDQDRLQESDQLQDRGRDRLLRDENQLLRDQDRLLRDEDKLLRDRDRDMLRDRTSMPGTRLGGAGSSGRGH